MIYFFIGEHESYNDVAIHLAEGLSEIGIPFVANRDFWQVEPDQPDFLFRNDPSVRPQDCAIVVFTTLWFHYMEPETFEIKCLDMPPRLLELGRKHKIVLLDAEDGYKTTSFQPLFRKFDVVFRTKMNRRTYNYPNMTPWVLGFGWRIIRATSNAPSFSCREHCIVQNFGYTHKFIHGVRRVAIDRFMNQVENQVPVDSQVTPHKEVPQQPWDLLMWCQTVGKHNPSYYSQIASAQCVACFCGDFVPGLPLDPSGLLVGGGRSRLRSKFFSILCRLLRLRDRIIQWDSWRFWETLLSGSVAIHVDLYKYGVCLPVMPENWRHYIGLDFEDIERDIQRFLKLDAGELSLIASSGRDWALEHYSPASSAQRFLIFNGKVESSNTNA